jgi:hypothetical protein
LQREVTDLERSRWEVAGDVLLVNGRVPDPTAARYYASMEPIRTPRPRAHEIDALAMRIVARVLPPAWVARTISSDYGVDLEVEPFQKGTSLGDLLLFQVKGTERNFPAGKPWRFSMKSKGIVYAERFIVPVILIICPVRAEPDQFRFLWLQDYVSVVLDEEKPNWRLQGSVTLEIPVRN